MYFYRVCFITNYLPCAIEHLDSPPFFGLGIGVAHLFLFLCCVFCFVLFVFVLSLLSNFTNISGRPLFILDSIYLFSGVCLRIYIILVKKTTDDKDRVLHLKDMMICCWFKYDHYIGSIRDILCITILCFVSLAQYGKQINSIS